MAALYIVYFYFPRCRDTHNRFCYSISFYLKLKKQITEENKQKLQTLPLKIFICVQMTYEQSEHVIEDTSVCLSNHAQVQTGVDKAYTVIR